MTAQNTRFPEPGTTLEVDGGRVELTVVDDAIWLSSYEGKTHQFTLVVPRKPLEGNRAALDGVAQRARSGARKASSSMMVAKAMERFKTTTPARAGYWYEDPDSRSHGGPVVIIEE